MNNEYRIRIDEHHVGDALQHRREVQRGRVWWLAIKAVCALGLAAILLAVVVAAAQPGSNPAMGLLVALVPVAFLLLLAFGPRIDHGLMKRRLKRSPLYGVELVIQVAEPGVSLTTPNSRSELAWAAFTKAHCLSEGILVFMGPSQFEWWPNAALVAGHRDDVERLVRGHVPQGK